MGFYLVGKGFEHKGHQEKADQEKYITIAQLQLILDAVKKSRKENPRFLRDHAMIFMGFYFGLRVGEVPLLTRQSFRMIERGKVFIKTLKVTPKILHHCAACNTEFRLSMRRSGTKFTCNCGETAMLARNPAGKGKTEPPEGSPPVVEPHVREYVQSYIKTLPKAQETLFLTRRGVPVSKQFCQCIFSTYLDLSGLPQIYAWHSLRHGRGVQLWERFHDLVVIQKMLRHTDISSAQVYAGISPSTLSGYSDKLEQDAVEV